MHEIFVNDKAESPEYRGFTSEQPEIDFYDSPRLHCLAIIRAWLEAPFLHRFHGLFVETHAEAPDDSDILRVPFGADDD